MTALEFSKWICDTLMQIPADKLPPEGGFHYHQGVALMGVQKTYTICGEEKYYNYTKEWIDSVINDDGTPKKYEGEHLDDLMAGMLLYMIYDKEKDEKYKQLLDKLVSHIDTWRENDKKGFWHKRECTHQMWLDGIFMYGPLVAEYGRRYDAEKYFDIVYEQLCIMWDNMRDDKTGLLYHAWDCSKQSQWCNKSTGLSPEFWGRALGWYTTALMDIYENISEKYRQDIKDKEILLLNALLKYQDKASGMWYQVVDKPGAEGNWTEVSCSCLYIYSICKAYNLGIIDESYMEYALRGYEGVISTLKADENGGAIVGGVCVGTGVGDYDFYIARPTHNNDLHGIGAVLYMLTEMEKAQRKLNL